MLDHLGQNRLDLARERISYEHNRSRSGDKIKTKRRSTFFCKAKKKRNICKTNTGIALLCKTNVADEKPRPNTLRLVMFVLFEVVFEFRVGLF